MCEMEMVPKGYQFCCVCPTHLAFSALRLVNRKHCVQDLSRDSVQRLKLVQNAAFCMLGGAVLGSLLHQLSAVCSVFLVTFRKSCAVCHCFNSAVKVYVEITEPKSSYTSTVANWVQGLFRLFCAMLPALFVWLQFVTLYILMFVWSTSSVTELSLSCT